MKKNLFKTIIETLLILVIILGSQRSSFAMELGVKEPNADSTGHYEMFPDYVDLIPQYQEFRNSLGLDELSGSSVITTFKTKELYVSGFDDESVVFVIMGDGFTKSEQDKFNNYAQSIADYILDTPPYDSMKDHINFYAVDVISNYSGVAHDPYDMKDTYFRSSYNISGIDRLLYPTDTSRVTATASYYFPYYDQILVLVNDEKYGGGGGSVCATGSINYLSTEIMVHEIGHSFGSLADEYYAGPQYLRESPNMTQESSPSKVKWKSFLKFLGIGIYPYETAYNWYRPSQNCKMRYLGKEYPYCKVCENQIKLSLKQLSKENKTTSFTDSAGKFKITNFNKKYVEFVKPSNSSKVKIPTYVTYKGRRFKVKSLSSKAFYNNKTVTSVTFPSGISEIPKACFKNCSKLTSITLPSSVKTIGSEAFYGCIGLKSLTIPSKVEKLGNGVWAKCKNLKTLKISSTVLSSKNISSKAFSNISSKTVIKVPKKKLSDYKKIFKKKGLSSKVKISGY